jgi:hypothetical protein
VRPCLPPRHRGRVVTPSESCAALEPAILSSDHAGKSRKYRIRTATSWIDDETWCLYDRMLIDDELAALWASLSGVRINAVG